MYSEYFSENKIENQKAWKKHEETGDSHACQKNNWDNSNDSDNRRKEIIAFGDIGWCKINHGMFNPSKELIPLFGNKAGYDFFPVHKFSVSKRYIIDRNQTIIFSKKNKI